MAHVITGGEAIETLDYLKNNGYEIPPDINVSELSADEVHFLTYKNKNRTSPPFKRQVDVKQIYS